MNCVINHGRNQKAKKRPSCLNERPNFSLSEGSEHAEGRKYTSATRFIDQPADSAAPNPKQATNVTTDGQRPLGISTPTPVPDFFPPLTSFCTLFWLFWGAKKGTDFFGVHPKKVPPLPFIFCDGLYTSHYDEKIYNDIFR
jgi:hypothetical protein